MNKIQAERLNLIINENFVSYKDCLTDIYLINGIKMTSYIQEVNAGKYLLLKNESADSASHLVLWSAIVTINKNSDNGKNKKNLEDEYNHNVQNKINLASLDFDKNHIFINKVLFIYLANGIKLDGLCVAIDCSNYIILEKNGKQQIILWSSVATMSLVVNNGEVVKTTINSKNNTPLINLINEKISVFLKTGIRLIGVLTDFSDSGYNDKTYAGDNDKDWELVLDNKQLVRMQHVSTITANKKD